MNFVVGKLDHAQRSFVANGFTLHLGDPLLSRLQRHEKVVLGVRPEAVGVSVTQCEGGLPARTYVTETLGNENFVFLDLGQEKIITRTNPAVRFDIGATVWLSFDETKFHFFDLDSGDRIP